MSVQESGVSWLRPTIPRLLWAAAAFVIGGALGVWIGGLMSCAGGGCKFRADVFGAVGTWVGGLGTIAAVLAAIAAFRGEERQRRQEDADLKALASELQRRTAASAKLVQAQWMPYEQIDGRFIGAWLKVWNRSPEHAIYLVRVEHEVYGDLTYSRDPTTTELHTLRPGSHNSFLLSDETTRSVFGDGLTRDGYQQLQDDLQKYRLSFEIEGERWERIGGESPRLVDGDDR